MLRLEDNPPVLAPWAGALADLRGRWWVAHTKARNEKAFAWDLHDRGIGYFLPLYERVYVSGGRRRRVLLPLFTSYVFFCGDEEDRYTAFTTNRICQAIPVKEQPLFVRELAAVHQALNHRRDLQPYPTIARGRVCRVVSGPFKGLEGPVVYVGKKAKIFLQVSVIAQGALLEVDARLLEPVW